MSDLREKLIEAKLAGHKNPRDGYPYCFRSNETAADAALAVVVEWLREQAAELTEEADFWREKVPDTFAAPEEIERRQHERDLAAARADALRNAADSIAPPKGDET
jgi:glutathione S-transferase